MICELCKQNNSHPGMFLTLIDVNGTNKLEVCQPCLKKLKNAYKSAKPQDITITPVKTKGK